MQHIAATPGYAGSSWPREIAACRAEIVRAITTPPPEIARFLDRTVERRRSAVLGVAAIEKNEIAWTAAAGGGDEAVFQAGSLSKTVTAAVALELVARGQLDLDGETRGTTVRDLLGHTAGANVPF